MSRRIQFYHAGRYASGVIRPSLLLALVLWLSGCGGAAKTMAPDHGDERRQAIAQMWEEIQGLERGEIGVRSGSLPEVDGSDTSKPVVTSPNQIDAAPASTARERPRPVDPELVNMCYARTETRVRQCADVCHLANRICQNAVSICRIARDLDDSWSRERCAGANNSCTRADSRCCGCK